MQTKIVYILISNEQDYYYEQLLVSLFSLRLFNPTAEVILVCDKFTQDTLAGKRTEYSNYISELKIVDVPNGLTPIKRSRYIKTNLRQFINGDYLFIDTDTIICSSLESIDSKESNISAVSEFNESFCINEWLKKDIELSDLSLIGWNNILNKNYCNSGVMFVRDNDLTHLFYKSWYKNWSVGASKGLLKDQPALGLTNEQFGNIIQELDGEWNCQILQKNRDKYVDNAKIIHYFGSIKELLSIYNLENIFLKIKLNGDIPNDFKVKLKIPQKTIFEKREVIKGKQIEFLHTNMYVLYENYSKTFFFLLSITKLYIQFRQKIWRLLHRLIDK